MNAFEWDVNEDGEINHDDAAEMLYEDVWPYYFEMIYGKDGDNPSSENEDRVVDEIFAICDFLKGLSWWNSDWGKRVIYDMYEISASEDGTVDSEKESWLTNMTLLFEIEMTDDFRKYLKE